MGDPSWVRRDGVRLYVERAGSGPPLLFISGTGGDLRNRPNAFGLPLASCVDLVTFDQRGMGQSDQPPGPYSMADYAEDAAAVLDAAGLEDASVMGVSFGGMVAQELALRHPERVRRLVLACTSAGGAGGASYPLHELVDLPVEERIATMVAITDSRWPSASFLDPLRDQLVRALRMAPPASPGARCQLEARRHHDTFDRLGAIACPTLVCGGRYDKVAPVENLQALTGAIRGARLELFEGGHQFLAQDPAAIAAVTEFLLSSDEG